MTIKKLATISSSTPLVALSASVLDTETTGLNVNKDQIIQIGGVKIDKGVPSQKPILDTYVKASRNISKTASRLTGISQQNLSYAPEFTVVKPLLDSFIRGSIVIGHHIDFDLAIINKECERRKLEWKKPRCLDTAYLIQIAEPRLHDYSLDAVMDYLNILPDHFGKRHTALGDALITREVFLRLVPRLRDIGVRTLSEAEAAINKIVRSKNTALQTSQITAELDDNNLTLQLDSFPYRHRVEDIMSKDVISLPPSTLLEKALNTLLKNKVSSIVVTSEEKGSESILTERNILEHIAISSNTPLKINIGTISRPLDASLKPNDFAYKAIGRMARLGLKHLPVRDGQENIIGIVTNRDLLGQRSGDAISLGDGIYRAKNIEDLAAIWAELPLLAKSLINDNFEATEIAAVISQELRSLTQKAAELSENDMLSAGRGKPPCLFTVMVLGSGGREESLLAMDQDNAIVYKNDSDQDVDDWFAEFGTRMNGILDSVGVPFCTGGIMAKNRNWRKSTIEWQSHIDHWIEQSSPEGILNADIFFDGIPVYGNIGLGNQILRYAYTKAAASSQFQFFLSVSIQRMKPALGMFGGLKTNSQKRVDLKAGGLLPIVSGARVLAMRHKNYQDHSTPNRLKSLLGESDISENDIEDIIETHKFIMQLILRQQIEDISNGLTPSAKVHRDLLTEREKKKLVKMLDKVSTIKHQVGGAHLPS